MKRSHLKRAAVAAGIVATTMCATNSPAQSSDALLDKLVEKGVLTQQDATELRDEMDQGFRKAYQVKSGMPDWVTALKFNGDFRGRMDSGFAENSEFVDRTRFRYRLRFGAVAVLQDNFEVGLRLTSSEPIGGPTSGTAGIFGGDPISGNTTLSGNASKKWIYVDLAYAKWYMLNTKQFSGSLTIGKMENPFVFPSLVFDGDYTPEGAGANFVWRLNDQHSLATSGGAFAISELSTDSSDPNMLGLQTRWNATWNKHISSTLGAAILSIQSAENLANATVPNINVGNYRSGAAGVLDYGFNPVVIDGAFTYTFDHGPLFKAPFPVRGFGTLMNNPAAPSSADNTGWEAGIQFGKAGKKGQWEASYTYRWLGANSWYEEIVDSDFGAYYATPWLNSGMSAANASSNYRAGTNVRGHILRVGYSPYDSLTFQITAFLTSLIEKTAPGTPAGSPTDGGNSNFTRLQVDAVWKF